MTDAPKIEPVKIKEYTCKQSKYGDLVPKLPTRATILAHSPQVKLCKCLSLG